MNLNPKQPSGTDAPSGRRASWFSKLSKKSESDKAKDTKLSSSSETASVTSHTPLVAPSGPDGRVDIVNGPLGPDGGVDTASTPYERSQFMDLMDKTKGMTPEQIKAVLAQDQKQHEDKFHEEATVGRWQWKFKDNTRADK